MKKILFAIGFLLISTAELAAQSLSEIINQKETILVDVRTPEEFAQGNVKNSINIPISELENNLSKLQGKKNIVVFCKAGIRAAKAEKLLKDKGIKNVYNGKTWENVKSLIEEKDCRDYIDLSRELLEIENDAGMIISALIKKFY